MATKHFIALIAAALLLTACSAEASIGAPSTAQPIPTQAPAQPQVIVVQQPVPQPAPAKQDDGLLIVFLCFLLVTAGCIALVVAYFGIRQMTTRPTPTPQPTPGNYLIEMTPADYQEWLQLQAYKARQIAEAQSQWMVRRGR